MKTTIKSQTLNRVLTLSRPGGYYIFADLNGQPGTLGAQICRGGETMGSTLGYSGDDPKAFNTICRAWYRAFLRTQK